MREKELLQKYDKLVEREFGMNIFVARLTVGLRTLVRPAWKYFFGESEYTRFLDEVANGRHPSNVLLDKTHPMN